MATVRYILQSAEWVANDPVFTPDINDTLMPLVKVGLQLLNDDRSVTGIITGITLDRGSNLVISIAPVTVVTSNS